MEEGAGHNFTLAAAAIPVKRRIAMLKKLTFVVAILALGATATVVFAQRQGTNTASAQGRYLPEYTKDGDLILPKNWRSWV